MLGYNSMRLCQDHRSARKRALRLSDHQKLNSCRVEKIQNQVWHPLYAFTTPWSNLRSVTSPAWWRWWNGVESVLLVHFGLLTPIYLGLNTTACKRNVCASSSKSYFLHDKTPCCRAKGITASPSTVIFSVRRIYCT